MYQVNAIKYQLQNQFSVSDLLTEEEILNISINQEPYSMTMRSPGDEEALIRGILLTENVYNNLIIHPDYNAVDTNEKGYITHANVNIPKELLLDGINTKRNLVSVSSCGMCGKTEMELTMQGAVIERTHSFTTAQIHSMFQAMSEKQVMFKETGGCHAAAIGNVDANLLSVKEDIGRHNAVDKVIGDVVLQGVLHEAKCLLVSGRVSYEIVSKCFRAGIPFLASVSAPSSLAIEYCEKAGITLLAFCRGETCTVYTHKDYIY